MKVETGVEIMEDHCYWLAPQALTNIAFLYHLGPTH